jgi:hypothetical protein
MVIILIRRCVRRDKEAEFLANYNREKPNHPDFVAEHLTKVNSSMDLPEPMRTLPIGEEDCITYVNVAFWKSAKSFEQNFQPKTMHDANIETADRVRVVLDIVEL